MYIEINLSEVPPSTVLREPDDFTSFKITVLGSEHARVSIGSLRELAGPRGTEPAWEEGFQKMLSYAERHGWIDTAGIRAHMEWPRIDLPG